MFLLSKYLLQLFGSCGSPLPLYKFDSLVLCHDSWLILLLDQYSWTNLVMASVGRFLSLSAVSSENHGALLFFIHLMAVKISSGEGGKVKFV